MKLYVFGFFLFAASALSCKDEPFGALIPQDANAIGVTDNNVPWTLTDAQLNGTVLSTVQLSPFVLCLQPNRLFGHDGCNRYCYEVECTGDTVIPVSGGGTEIACDEAGLSHAELYRR